MTTVISPDDYCKHPEDYKNTPGIDNVTRAYWDNYCLLKKQAQSQPMPPAESKWWSIQDGLENFIAAFFSPTSLEMLAGIMGGPIAYKYIIKNVLGKITQLTLDDVTRAAAEDFIKNGGDAFVANGCSLLSQIFGNMVYLDVKVAEEAGYSAGRLAAAQLLRGMEMLGEQIAEFLDLDNPLMMAMLALQIVSSVLDAWDPCKLDLMLTADNLKDYSMQYNNQFREHILVSVETSQDSYGHITLNAVWPLEYYAERSALIPFKNNVYDPIRSKLFMQYMNSLRVNSNGDPIYHGLGGNLVSNEMIASLNLNIFGNNNTVVENVLYKYWPLFAGGALLLIVIFILIRNRK